MKRGFRGILQKAPFGLAFAGLVVSGGGADAQLGAVLAGTSGAAPVSAGTPVTFLADQVSYDKTGNLVIATGHVRAWQNGQTLYADKVVINRNTDVATATGHVILLEPNGETIFAGDAVLSQGMKNAVMQGVSARLAENGRFIANGARRYNDQIDEMVKVMYSACDLCKTDPTAPPLWQIRARSATRDLQHKMIEYRDAEMEIHGFPVFYIPYMTQPDPSVRRATGLLIPNFGDSSRLGLFVAVPYFIVINPESDITLTPIIGTKQGPVLDAKYRRAFNDGVLNIDLSGGRDRHTLGDSVFSNGTFDLNDTWRAGFSYNHASNPQYLDDFNILPNATELTSDAYVEGFGPGSYGRLEADTYQGLVASVTQSDLPIVAPYGQYDFESDPDSFGGRTNLDAEVFNVLRDVGTNTRRVSAVGTYTIPFQGPLGQLYTARVEVIAASYQATGLDQQPSYSTINSADTSRAQAYGALFMRWPFARSAGSLGSQIVEPEVQLVASPEIGTTENYRIPNEDSLDLEYSDANLFDLNRYPGIDRLEGGERVDYAMHDAWYLPGGAMLDGLVGQSYRFHKDDDYLPGSGLNDHFSDIVARATVEPTSWFNLTYRTRLSHVDLGRRMIDATATVGDSTFNLSGGYLYANTNPYVLGTAASLPAAYFIARNEFTANISSTIGAYTVTAGTERNIQTGQFDAASFTAGWQNECAAVNINFYERFTSYNLDDGSTTLLIQFTFKTLGNVGFSAL
jgi:LPS-assembly protein